MSEYKYYIKQIYQGAPDLVTLEVVNKDDKPVFNFRPGQYAMITYKNSQGKIIDKHAFSIASSPTRRDSLIFGIRIGGTFTKGLLDLKVGAELIVAGPYGNFCYEEKKYSDLVMIAGGIGITPFLSGMTYATDLKLNNKLALIYSARKAQDAPFYGEIKNLMRNNSNISALFSFTEDTAISSEKGVINKRIDTQAISDFIGSDITKKTFFLCGPPPFMTAVTNCLLSLGVSKDCIKMEAFSMIPDKSITSRLKNLSYALSLAVVLFIISFYLINQSASALNQKNYNQALVDKVNQGAINRLASVYEAKNKALIDLNNRIISATQGGGGSSGSTAPSAGTTVTPTPPVQTYIPAPVSIPTPRTRVS